MRRLVFAPNPKHRSRKRGQISPQPTNGQTVLDRSVQVTKGSPRRVGVDPINGELVIFMQHLPNVFHGFVVEWRELPVAAQRALIREGLVTRRGRIRPST